MQTAKSSTIIDDSFKVIRIEGDNHDDIESSVKQFIAFIKKRILHIGEDEHNNRI